MHSTVINNEALVQDFWSNHEWNFQLLLECLPSHVVDQIAKIPFSHFGDSSDKLTWQSSSNEDFSVRSAYNIAASCESDSLVMWKGIWTLNIPLKLKHFAWTVAHGRLLTNASRYSRHLCIDPYCSLC